MVKDLVEIEIEDELYSQLEGIANEDGVTVEELVSKIVKDYIEKLDDGFREDNYEEDYCDEDEWET